jgi:hypothetical protein
MGAGGEVCLGVPPCFRTFAVRSTPGHCGHTHPEAVGGHLDAVAIAAALARRSRTRGVAVRTDRAAGPRLVQTNGWLRPRTRPLRAYASARLLRALRRQLGLPLWRCASQGRASAETLPRLTPALAASADWEVRGKPSAELVGFGEAELGVDVQGRLPVAAALDMIALCAVGAAEAVVGPCLLEPFADLSRDFEGVGIRPAGQVRATRGQVYFAEADVCLGGDGSLPDLG